VVDRDGIDPGKAYQGYHNHKGATEAKFAHDVLREGDCYFRIADIVSGGPLTDPLDFVHSKTV